MHGLLTKQKNFAGDEPQFHVSVVEQAPLRVPATHEFADLESPAPSQDRRRRALRCRRCVRPAVCVGGIGLRFNSRRHRPKTFSLERAAEGEVDRRAAELCVFAVLQLGDAVIAEARRAAPDGDVAVAQGEFAAGGRCASGRRTGKSPAGRAIPRRSAAAKSRSFLS